MLIYVSVRLNFVSYNFPLKFTFLSNKLSYVKEIQVMQIIRFDETFDCLKLSILKERILTARNFRGLL